MRPYLLSCLLAYFILDFFTHFLLTRAPGGSYGNRTGLHNKLQCKLCPAAAYCPTASTLPLPCPPGTHSVWKGASQCTACPVRARCIRALVRAVYSPFILVGRQVATREIPVTRTNELDAHCLRGSVRARASRPVVTRVCHSQLRLLPRRRTRMRSTSQSVDG